MTFFVENLWDLRSLTPPNRATPLEAISDGPRFPKNPSGATDCYFDREMHSKIFSFTKIECK